MIYIIFLLAFIIYFIYNFDKKNISVEKLILIALLGAIASVGRVIFAGIPSVQPASYMVMVGGIVLGKKEGTIIGILLALLSNLILGFGPYVLWQCFSWGLMGYTSGIFAKLLKKNIFVFLSFAFIWGLVFGFIMNTSTIYLMSLEFNFKTLVALMILSLPMDIAHGLSNFLLVLFTSKKFISILERISIKYGVV